MIGALRNFYRTLSTGDRRIVFFVVLGALLLTSVPYIAGYAVAGQNYGYLALNPLGSADTNVYFSFIHQVADGEVFVRNLHTSEPQAGSIFHPLWLVLGWIAGLFHLSIPLVFHGARLVLGAAFLLTFYFVLAEVFSDSRRRNIAFVLAAFSSGIGVLFSLNISQFDPNQVMLLLPSDQWIPESNTFLTLLHSPLFILSQLLLLILFWYFLWDEKVRSPLLVGAVAFFLALIHPYDTVTLAVVAGAFFLLRILRDPTFRAWDARRFFRHLLLVGACIVPVLGYFVLIGKIEPAIGGWTRQNVTTSPMLHSYILGYGWIVVFAVLGFALLRKTTSRAQLLVLAWSVSSVLLLYVPVQINRRFTNGLHLPLVILAAVGIDHLWRWLRRRVPQETIRATMIRSTIVWLVSLGLFFGTVATVVKAVYWEWNAATSIYHRPRGVLEAMDWLRGHTGDDPVLLAHSYHGNVIPARSGLRVFVGHGHQTIDWERKRALVTDWFFRTNDDDEAKLAFLHENAITHIFFAQLEDNIGDFSPAEKTYLTLIFRNDDVRIYRVL